MGQSYMTGCCQGWVPPSTPTPKIERGRGEGGRLYIHTDTVTTGNISSFGMLAKRKKGSRERPRMKCKLSALGTSTLLIEIWMNTTRVLVSSKPMQPITINITNYAATYSWRKLLRLRTLHSGAPSRKM